MRTRFLLGILWLSLSCSAFADSYTRGNYHCGSFSEAEKTYKNNPDGVHSRVGYAACLILKGEDDKGLRILNQVVKQDNDVNAAFTLAEYIETGGTFKNTDNDKLNEAIKAHQRVLSLIALDSKYPFNGNMLYEADSQMELNSFYSIPFLFDLKFGEGVNGSHNYYSLVSPSYEGKRDLNTHEDYRPYTMDSLRKTIEHSDRCISLPKKRYFRKKKYEKVKAACRVLKEGAVAMLPLEEKRLRALEKESCRKDILKCAEYDEVINKMVDLVKQGNSAMEAIWGEQLRSSE